MTTLLSEHRLCVEEVELNVSAEETVMSVTSNKLYYLPGLEGSDIVKAAKDEALSAWRGAVFRKKVCICDGLMTMLIAHCVTLHPDEGGDGARKKEGKEEEEEEVK